MLNLEQINPDKLIKSFPTQFLEHYSYNFWAIILLVVTIILAIIFLIGCFIFIPDRFSEEPFSAWAGLIFGLGLVIAAAVGTAILWNRVTDTVTSELQIWMLENQVNFGERMFNDWFLKNYGKFQISDYQLGLMIKDMQNIGIWNM
ncbi:hypothetical protein ELUMI_v1c05550 [Williamsoniiplasma luminosum]|uniref:Uncharacterized protein n=1 Tax=Williamsoniiplasma luminosum TaxID=214888 RepID=A0A2K8NU04_9MOLU|nr:hypothetical protein [Williamsoniiplasma luminosum]ATZ17279.1 hypothetical protein ELUMI_v1c05550 [Williamsoniiplasma luminosum]